MSGSEWAALIVAVTGVLGAIFAGLRNLRGDKIKEEVGAAAAVLSGHVGMVALVQSEMTRMKTQHAEDRQVWLEERATLRREHIEALAALRAEHAEEIRVASERIDELGAQVYALQHRPPETHDREEDLP